MDNRMTQEETVIEVINKVLEEVLEKVIEEDAVDTVDVVEEEEEEEEEEVVEYKVYKEKPYLNSDRDPLGISLNGKTKEYVHAHESIKNVLKKGKQYSFDAGNM
jgi:hypothetical protein